MVKDELLKAMARHTRGTVMAAEANLDAFLAVVTEHIRTGGVVRIGGFGEFTLRVRPEKWRRLPTSTQKVLMAEKHFMKFKPAKAMVKYLTEEK